jgi:AcrR family transcriptional regulator
MTESVTTKDKILDMAEVLFAERGYDATSLRTITAEAGVNLASVNYHFQTKDALLHAVVARRANPLNRRRLQLLDESEARWQNEPIPVEELLDALCRPILLEMGTAITRMMVRFQFFEKQEAFRSLFAVHLKPVVERFIPALHRSLPHLTLAELLLRVQLCFGSLAQILVGSHVAQTVSEGRITMPTRDEAFQQFIQFAAAGLRAPAGRSTSAGTGTTS